jgi:hypothetical protein
MVDVKGPGGKTSQSIDNTMIIIPGILLVLFICK